MDDLIREMINPPRATTLDPARRLRLVATCATVALAAAGVTSLTTGALFTDQESMSATDFTTGTVQITPDKLKTAGLTLGSGNLAPGDTTYGAVTVENEGSLALRYAITQVATNPAAQTVDLAAELDLSVYAADPPTDATASCTAAGLGALTLIASRTGLPTVATPLLGSFDQGNNAGDRSLNARTSETLCFVINLPLSTDNVFQGTTADVTFTFDAEQTANNP